MALRDLIQNTVRADERQMGGFTERMVRVPSENPPGTSYEQCVDVITNELTEIGIDFEVIEIPVPRTGEDATPYPRFAVLARNGDGEPTLHFHGHYDVVPADSRDLFKPVVRGRNLHGRGSSDMKSGLAAMIYAVKAIKTCDSPLNGTVALSIVPDEETGGVLGSQYLAGAGLVAAEGVGMLTAEPTSGAVWNASRGAISLLVTVKGKPMHVGLQHDGVNAFDKMLMVANALTELKDEVERRATEFNIQPDAARRSILMLGGICRGGTNFNLVPGECSFTVDRRINPEEDLQVEKQRLFDLFDRLRHDGIEIEVELLQEGGSAGVSEEDPVARALAANIETITGAVPEFEMCPGLLETRFYAANGIPAFAYGPGLLSVSHGPDEHVPIDNIVDCASIYALTALDVLSA